MENVTTKKRELAPELMARVDACAYIFMADEPDKISAIMESRNVTELEAGRIYTIGTLKEAKRRGTARNYREALEALEAEQAGDRGNPLTRTISADKTARTVSRYQRMNDNSPMRTNTVDVVRMAWARMDNQLYTAYAQPRNWHVEDRQTVEEKPTHARNTGKIAGSMYTDMVYKQERLDPVYSAYEAVMDKNLKVFFTEYISRLSRMVKMRLANFAGYINRESNGNALKAERVISALTSAKGRKAPETSKMANFAVNLHRNFEHKDAVSCPEFISLLYRYGMDGMDGMDGTVS
jgi:hypothetical protein